MFKRQGASNQLLEILLGKRLKNLWSFALLVFVSLIAALFEGVSFGFLLHAFSGLEKNENFFNTIIRAWMKVLGEGTPLFVICVMLAILLQIFRSGLCYLSTIVSTQIGYRIQTTLQSAIYDQILKMSYSYVTYKKVGELLESARSPAQFVQPMLEGVNRLIVSILASVVIIGIMFFLDVRLTFLTIALFGTFAFLQKATIRKILRSSNLFSQHLMEVNQETSQLLQGVKIIHTFCRQEKIKEKVQKKVEEIGVTGKKVYLFSNVVPYLNEMVSVIVLGIILVAAILFIGVEKESFLSILMTFLLVTYRLSTRLQNAIGVLGTTSAYYGHFLRVLEILDDKDKEFLPKDGAPFSGSFHKISVNRVFFSYPCKKQQVLKDISFVIPRGTMTGIVGLSGAGKTTLIDLILRLYEPSKGEIIVDNEKITKYSLSSWRNSFGVVAQDPFLFDESIEENICFGIDKVSQKKVEAVARLTGVDRMVAKMPQGYQTVVGERGLRLSGGERQRVALARALLRDPEILILDEATSNLDSQSEFYIQKVLEEIKKEKTLVVIAHRLSTIVRSDQIIVMEHGTVQETGTHEKLLERGDLYADLWKLQTEKIINEENIYEKSLSNRE